MGPLRIAHAWYAMCSAGLLPDIDDVEDGGMVEFRNEGSSRPSASVSSDDTQGMLVLCMLLFALRKCHTHAGTIQFSC